MQVNRPTAKSNIIKMSTLLHNVLLNQHIIPFKTTTFAFAGNMPHPLQREIFGFGKIARIFDVIPYTVNHFPQFPLDGFGFVNGVQTPAVLNPPEFTAKLLRVERTEFRYFLGDIVRKTRRYKGDGFAGIFGIKVKAMPQQFAVFFGRSKLLPEFLLRLRTHPKSRTRQKP